jgi:formate dehydrogenase subunit gamma
MRQAIGARVARALLFAFCAAVAGSVLAEQIPTPAPTPENTGPAPQVQRQVEQPLNSAPVWREVRSGGPAVTTVRGRETNVLIQSGGQTWRSLRNSDISVYGGWALVLIFLAIVTFYMLKGTMQLHHPPTGRKILRFTWVDRVIHWSTAIAFSTLAITGLIMLFGKTVLLPILGYTLFSWLAILSKNLHNFVGPLFAVCIIFLFANFVRDNFPQPGDWLWIKRFGGLFSGQDTPSCKFNAGEKIWFWGGAIVLGILVSITGFVLDFPNFNQTRQTMQISHVLHSTGAILFMLGSLGHIYMGTLGMAGAYDAMRTGYVDEEWAREHHEYWYNQVKTGKVHPVTPAAGPTARPRVA